MSTKESDGHEKNIYNFASKRPKISKCKKDF